MSTAAVRSTMAAATLTLGAAATVGGCGDAGPPEVTATDAAVGANTGPTAALYVELENSGGSDDTLLGATCECAGTTSLHVVEDRDGILLMVPTDEVPVPAGSTVRLDPGRAHVMLEDLDEPLETGDTGDVRLEFAETAPLAVEVPVLAPENLAERVEVGDTGRGENGDGP